MNGAVESCVDVRAPVLGQCQVFCFEGLNGAVESVILQEYHLTWLTICLSLE